jgi:hypothetical protein
LHHCNTFYIHGIFTMSAIRARFAASHAAKRAAIAIRDASLALFEIQVRTVPIALAWAAQIHILGHTQKDVVQPKTADELATPSRRTFLNARAGAHLPFRGLYTVTILAVRVFGAGALVRHESLGRTGQDTAVFLDGFHIQGIVGFPKVRWGICQILN